MPVVLLAVLAVMVSNVVDELEADHLDSLVPGHLNPEAPTWPGVSVQVRRSAHRHCCPHLERNGRRDSKRAAHRLQRRAFRQGARVRHPMGLVWID